MAEQKDLFNRFVDPLASHPDPLARNTDPATSHLAAQEIESEGKLAGLRRRAFELVRNNKGKIARELSEIAGDSDARTINRRLGEVEKAGLIYRGKERRCKVTGRMCATWWPTIPKKGDLLE